MHKCKFNTKNRLNKSICTYGILVTIELSHNLCTFISKIIKIKSMSALKKSENTLRKLNVFKNMFYNL